MKVLIVASSTANKFSSFVVEQANALQKEGVEIDYYGINKNGVVGYLQCRAGLLTKIKEFRPDIVHAHYGLSGLLANLQRKIPVITTYHGSDIHSLGINLMLSRICMRLSRFNVIVSQNLFNIAKYTGKNVAILSCGLSLSEIVSCDRNEARSRLGLSLSKTYILFSSSFNNAIKNYDLAKNSTDIIGNCELIELKGYTRAEVSLLMNAVNVQLTTSHNESGPLVVKEAMACGTPIVTTDVGDVRWVIGDTEGCYITSYDPDECADAIGKAIEFSKTKGKTNGRARIIELGLDNSLIAKRLINIIYANILHK